MKKVIQKLTDWRDAWANGRPFNPELSGCRPFTFGEFFDLASKAVVADGGKYDEFHGVLSFPPAIAGRWVEISRDEIYKKIWK